MKLTWWVDASYAVHSNMKGLVAWEVLLDPEDCEDEPTQEQQSEIQNQLEQPVALYAASTDPDVLYLHEAPKVENQQEFLKAMDTEITT